MSKLRKWIRKLFKRDGAAVPLRKIPDEEWEAMRARAIARGRQGGHLEARLDGMKGIVGS